MTPSLVLFLLTAWPQGDRVEPWTVAEGPVSQPQVAIGMSADRPRFHVAYARDGRQVAVRTFDALGAGGEERLLQGAQTIAGMRRGPRIAVNADAVCVSAIVFDRAAKIEGDLRSWVSADGGLTFTGPFAVTDQPGAAREGLHDMARAPAGQLACVWLDLRSGAMEVYASFSADGGRSWQPNLRVYRAPAGSVCECCAPTAAFDSAGRLHVLFRNSLDGNRDMWLAHGTAQGFDPPVKLGQGSWKLAGCPMAPGGLVPQRDALLSLWSRDDKIFRCAAGGLEELLGQGKELAAGGGVRGAYLAWIEGGAAGELKLLEPGAKSARLLASQAHWPAFSAGAEGLPLALAWEEHGADGVALKMRIIQHAGPPPAAPK